MGRSANARKLKLRCRERKHDHDRNELGGTQTESSHVYREFSTASRAPSTASIHLSATSANPSVASPSVSAASRAAAGSLWSAIDSGSEDDINDAQEEYVLAMHDFSPQQQNVTCLSFRAGQVIHVLNRDSSGWWDGELDGRRGWFPSNYVTSEVGLLTDEQLPSAKNSRPGHSQTMSTSSTTSWTSTTSRKSKTAFSRNDHRPTAADSYGPSINMYCPPLMLPLLRGLSLLQNAVRMNRIHHFQPATACIISCVRALLSEIGCLSRDAPVLKQHGVLAQERKRILSDLASLVSQAKRASQETIAEDSRDIEVEAMVRLAGQLFAHVRGFLAVAVQCGVNLPSNAVRNALEESESTLPDGRWASTNGTLVQDDEQSDDCFTTPARSTNGIGARPRRMTNTMTPTPTRPKSLGDLKVPKRAAMGADYPPMPTGPLRIPQRKLSEQQLASPARRFVASSGALGHKAAQDSISSNSSTSSSSFSSSDSSGAPATPVFPSGPATSAELTEALRATHDAFLSTIAAFIGHAHSHSRTSHASSTGHMYDLVREVVDTVCRLLTLVEAVLRHPDVPLPKAAALRSAKESVYNVTSSLADAVRVLAGAPPEDLSEEEEKARLLKCATDALKAGSDCAAAVKRCLQRATGERPFVFHLPVPGEPDAGAYTPRKFSHAHRASEASVNGGGGGVAAAGGPRIRRASSLVALHGPYVSGARQGEEDGEEEDMTIQAQSVEETGHTMTAKRPSVEEIAISEEPPSPSTSPAPSPSSTPIPHGEATEEAAPALAAPEVPNKSLPPADTRPSLDTVRSDALSLRSYAPTEDDRTTWEGSQRHGPTPSISTFEEKLMSGELPPVPTSRLATTVLPWTFPHDHSPEDVAYNSDGQLVGATLAALVERMTPHDSLVEPPFAAVFFMTFRLFTTPAELLDAVITRYNILPPPGLSDADLRLWQQRKGLPVRLRVSNFIKTWVESYWRHATDSAVVPTLISFTKEALSIMFPGPSQRILELIHQRMHSSENVSRATAATKGDRLRDAGIPLNPPVVLPGPISEIPRPIMTKTVLAALRSATFAAVAVTDFDALELARQLTVMECTLYCAIQPEELLLDGAAATGGNTTGSPARVKAVTSLSTAITGWVAESILNEPDTKKRTALVKFFIKLADRCVSLRNYSTPRSILAALDSSTIARLHQTWMGLPQKYKVQLEVLRKLADHARNYHEYRSRLRNTAPPAVPFLGLYLTDLTFCREGNPSHRTSPKAPEKKLINFNKYHKLARIVQDMQRFQVPYNLKEIPEVQAYLRDAFEKSQRQGDLQDLYRRSLLVEPKQSAETPPSSDVRQLFAWASRSQPSVSPTSAS
ncbi:ras guanine nucleotide exchange factor domain-containing protein [Trametes punicea]|nr:ras guanine nucleotide exchange factor domain-containing protein [Trametes punicea]